MEMLDLFARLFQYPGAADEELAMPSSLAEFGAEMRARPLEERQELFIQTFDMNPDCCLEIGWHLFGENYDRGEFLVRMRGEMRRFGLPETAELPDHLGHVLPVVARMDEADAREFAGQFLAPALAKMRKALAGKQNPYGRLVEALDDHIRAVWPDLPAPAPESASAFQIVGQEYQSYAGGMDD